MADARRHRASRTPSSSTCSPWKPSVAEEKPYLPIALLDVLTRVEQGQTYEQIAAETYHALDTVYERAARARDALGIRRYTIAAARRARQLGLLPE